MSYGSVLTGMYTTCIYVFPISIPVLLPCSIKSYSCYITLYLIPCLIRKPTPLLPLTALSKLFPDHSYPLMFISSYPFKCVSETANMSGFSSYSICITLYFLAIRPLTFAWIIFNVLWFYYIIYGLVTLKYSSNLVYLLFFLSS